LPGVLWISIIIKNLDIDLPAGKSILHGLADISILISRLYFLITGWRIACIIF
jgi:hypothetical protein